MSNTSGKALGKEYLSRVQEYLARADALPVSPDGSLNITAIAAAAGVPKQSIYKNPSIREAVDRAKVEKGVTSWADKRTEAARTAVAAARESGDGVGAAEAVTAPTDGNGKRLQAAERRLSALEQQNAALVAENAELRRQLKAFRLQAGRDDMTIDTGRRIPAPPAHG